MEDINKDFLSPNMNYGEDVAGAAKLNAVFGLLDNSGSTNLDAGDGQTIHQKGKDMILGCANRLDKGGKGDCFAMGVYTFNTQVKPIIPIEKATTPSSVTDFQSNVGGGTDIAKVLNYTKSELDKLATQQDVFEFVTVFLLTDGLSNTSAMIQAANELKAHSLSPSIAVIALGNQAKTADLLQVASNLNEDQKLKLAHANVTLENSDKMFIRGHMPDGNIPNTLLEASRNFLWILSQTV